MNFAAARELAPYLAGSAAIPAGTVGKSGYLYMGFELDGDGRSVLRDLERHAPLIVQQELYFDEQMPQMPCVYILSSGGPNVDGDRYRQHIVVRRDAFAHISTGAATKLAEMRHDFSALSQRFELEAGAYLEFLPEPTIPCRHTRYISSTELIVDPSATLFYSEIYLSGRKYYGQGERFLYDILSVETSARRPDSTPLLREKFIIRPHRLTPSTLGAMADCDVFANVVVLTPPQHAEVIYSRTEAFIDPRWHLAAGISRLPSQCGLSYKVLGEESAPVKSLVREFCSAVRQQVKGHRLPDEFPWR